MFRTAVRRFATMAVRSAETVAAPSAHLIEIAKAQRIAKDGFIDGKLPVCPVDRLLYPIQHVKTELTDLQRLLYSHR